MYQLIEDNKFPELEKKISEFRKKFKPIPNYVQHLYFETLKLAEFYLSSEDHENVVRVVMDEIRTLPFDAPYPSFFLLQYFTNSFLKIYSRAEFCEILDRIKNEHDSLDDFKNNVILLLCWRTNSGPSLAAFPAINSLFSKLRDKGFFPIGVTSFQGRYSDEEISVNDITESEELEFIEKLLLKHNVKFPVGLLEKSVFNPDYGITSTPACVLIDREGYVRYVSKGLSNESLKDIEEQIQKLVGNESY